MFQHRSSKRTLSPKKHPNNYPPMETVSALLQSGLAIGVNYPPASTTTQQRIVAVTTDGKTVTSLQTEEKVTHYKNTMSGVALRQTDVVATALLTVALTQEACIRDQHTAPSIDVPCATTQIITLSSDEEDDVRAATASSNGDRIVINQAPPLPEANRCEIKKTDLHTLLFSSEYKQATTPSILTLIAKENFNGTTALSDVAIVTVMAPSDTLHKGQVEMPIENPFIVGEGDKAFIFKPLNTIVEGMPIQFINRFYVYRQSDLQQSSLEQKPLFIINSVDQFIFQIRLADAVDEFGKVTHRELILARKNCFKGEIIRISNVDRYTEGQVIDLSADNLSSQGIYKITGAKFSDRVVDPKYQPHSIDLLTERFKDSDGKLQQLSYLVVGTTGDDNRVRIIDLKTIDRDFKLNEERADAITPTILQIQSSLPVIRDDEYNEFGYSVAVVGRVNFGRNLSTVESRYIMVSNPKANELFILSPFAIHEWMQRYPRQVNTILSHTVWIAGIAEDIRANRSFCAELGEKIFVSQDRRFLGSECRANKQVIIDMQSWLDTMNITEKEDIVINQRNIQALQQKQTEQINLAAGLMFLLPNITSMSFYVATMLTDAIQATAERALTMSQNITIVDCSYDVSPVAEASSWSTTSMLALGAGVVVTGLACLGIFRQHRRDSVNANEDSGLSEVAGLMRN